MKIVALYAGLDYHQASVQVCVMDREGNMMVNDAAENDWRDIVRLVGAKGRRVHAAIEACRGRNPLGSSLGSGKKKIGKRPYTKRSHLGLLLQ